MMCRFIYTLYTLDRSILLNAGLLRATSASCRKVGAESHLPPRSASEPHCMRLQSTVFGAFARALPDVCQQPAATAGR